MYKDKVTQREYNRQRMQRVRGNTGQGNTEESVLPDGMIADEQGIAYFPLKAGLKGQRWYPGRNGYHPPKCICGIRHSPSPEPA